MNISDQIHRKLCPKLLYVLRKRTKSSKIRPGVLYPLILPSFYFTPLTSSKVVYSYILVSPGSMWFWFKTCFSYCLLKFYFVFIFVFCCWDVQNVVHIFLLLGCFTIRVHHLSHFWWKMKCFVIPQHAFFLYYE